MIHAGVVAGQALIGREVSYESLVLLDDPIAYWWLNEASGTTYADHSGHGRDATLSGSGVVQGDTALFSTRSGSLRFTGTAFLYAANPFGNNDDITVETWFEFDGTHEVFVFGRGADDVGSWSVVFSVAADGVMSANVVTTSGGTAGHTVSSASGAVTPGARHHLVWKWLQGVGVSMYVDGVPLTVTGGTISASGLRDPAGSPIYVGTGFTQSGHSSVGVLGDLALYAHDLSDAQVEAHFVAAPSAPAVPIYASRFASKFDGTDGGTDAVEENGHTLHFLGAAALATASAQFGATGLLVPSAVAGDGLYCEAAEFAPGAGPFFIRGWFAPGDLSVRAYQKIIETRSVGSQGFAIYLDNATSPGTYQLAVANDAAVTIAGTGAVFITAGVPVYLELSRDESNALRLFANGALVGSVTDSRTLDLTRIEFGTTGSQAIANASSYDEWEFDTVVGHVAAYTPPNVGLGDVDPFWSSVVLLIKGEGTDGSTDITDLSDSAHALTVHGGVALNGSYAPYGTSSIAVPAGGFLSTPTDDDFDLGRAPFTVECWLRRYNAPEDYARIFQTRDGDVYAALSICLLASNTTLSASTSGTGFEASASGTPVTDVGTWHHHAICSDGYGSDIVWRYDGVAHGAMAHPGALYYNASDTVVVGGQSSPSRSLLATIKDFRVTKGVNRYPDDFTPPGNLPVG